MTTQAFARAATVIAIAASAAGLTVPAAQAGTEPTHVANAQLRNPSCTVPPNRDLDVTKKIYQVGTDLKVSSTVMMSAFETGWVESHMNNLNCGDADSVGVFQQRPSQGWCDEAKDCMNVGHAAKKYFEAAKDAEQANPSHYSWEIAQDVQRSEFPARYKEAKDKAEKLLDEAKDSSNRF